MVEKVKDFPEEELNSLFSKIKNIKKQINNLDRERLKIEKEYNLKYNFINWKKKEKKYFFVEGKRKNEIYYCYVITVSKKIKELEFIDVKERYYAREKITDPLEEPGYSRWTEISKEEYEKEKEGLSYAK